MIEELRRPINPKSRSERNKRRQRLFEQSVTEFPETPIVVQINNNTMLYQKETLVSSKSYNTCMYLN